MSLLLPETDYEALAHVNWGIWIARCPRVPCTSAEHLGAHPISGHVGGLTLPPDRKGTAGGFRCGNCTWEGPSRWPTYDERVAIERLLAMRPVPSTRNWLPGEEVRALVVENVQHGVMSARTPDRELGR